MSNLQIKHLFVKNLTEKTFKFLERSKVIDNILRKLLLFRKVKVEDFGAILKDETVFH